MNQKLFSVSLWLPVKDCLCIDIMEIEFLSSLWHLKNELRKQSIRLIEIPIYIMYFSKMHYSKPTKTVESQQNIFTEMVKWVI